MEEEECIICLEIIDKNIGDYRIELCDQCKYNIHISCWENYIKFRGNSYCVVCNKVINDGNIIHTVEVEPINNNINIVDNNRKKNILFVIFFITICFCIFIMIKTI